MIDITEIKENNNSIYLNFPFCGTSCMYCHYIDNIKFGYAVIPKEYISIIIEQLDGILKKIPNIVLESIYFGGGTPSLLTDKQLEKIENVFKKYNVTAKEVSIEVHPGACNFDYLKNSFFTRYSIGIQSFDESRLLSYNRTNYSVESVKVMITNIKESNISRIINIDLIFDEILNDIEYKYIKQFTPDTITLYPNTKGRGLTRYKNIKMTLEKAKDQLVGYHPLAKSEFIFIKDESTQSLYSKNQYELNNDIIGLGHNSVSYIGNKTYLTRYTDNKVNISERITGVDRYLTSILSGISIGVLQYFIRKYMPDLLGLHFLRTVDSDRDISEKHSCSKDDDLVYLPKDEYIRFYEYLADNYNQKVASIFLNVVGFGDSNVEIIKEYYNSMLLVSKCDIQRLKNKIGKDNIQLKKIRTPKMNILVEGIDGSGKDTFVDFLVQELRKKFLYDNESKISVTGQPNSRLTYGIEAKKFVEDIEYTGPQEKIKTMLTTNRIESEKLIDKYKGITILIRGVVTDKATFNCVFGKDEELGEGKIIKEWDKYIVITVNPDIADKRISFRGIPRTWREQRKYLKFFNEYYKKYTNSIFKEKIIIENNNLEKLKLYAKNMAEDIYADEIKKQ